MLPVNALVEVKSLRVTFPDPTYGFSPVVDGVSFELADGDTMALVGESGCGKTLSALTLLRLAPPEARVSAARLEVSGEDLLTTDAATLSGLRGGVVGLVLQEPAQALNPVRTIGVQVAEAGRLHLDLGRAEAREVAAGLLAEVGVEPHRAMLDAYPHQLSGGQRQRVLLACALSGRPRLVIADEPTSALDTVTARRMIAVLERLHSTRGVALIIISHDLPLVAPAVSWVTVLYAGETVEIARRDDVLHAPAHPYSTALVDMLPRDGRRPRRPLPTIPGQVARPGSWGLGCRFAPRCPMAFGRCGEAHPALVPTEHGRWVRCFLFSSEEQSDG
jgi:oligopeptide/dipeptide ABC transporter ATP-binding protein